MSPDQCLDYWLGSPVRRGGAVCPRMAHTQGVEKEATAPEEELRPREGTRYVCGLLSSSWAVIPMTNHRFSSYKRVAFPSSSDLPDPGIELLLHWQGSLSLCPRGALKGTRYINKQAYYDHGFENSIVKMSVLPKVIYGFQAVLTENCCCCCYC